MFNYIAKKLFKYIKHLIPKREVPLIEEAPTIHFYKGDANIYDITRPSFALNYWVPSNKTFYTLDVDSKQFIKISSSVKILEMSLCKPNCETFFKNKPCVISRPLNLYVFNEETQEFDAYKSKLKICLDF